MDKSVGKFITDIDALKNLYKWLPDYALTSLFNYNPATQEIYKIINTDMDKHYLDSLIEENDMEFFSILYKLWIRYCIYYNSLLEIDLGESKKEINKKINYLLENYLIYIEDIQIFPIYGFTACCMMIYLRTVKNNSQLDEQYGCSLTLLHEETDLDSEDKYYFKQFRAVLQDYSYSKLPVSLQVNESERYVLNAYLEKLQMDSLDRNPFNNFDFGLSTKQRRYTNR